jgi:hypothetical protein
LKAFDEAQKWSFGTEASAPVSAPGVADFGRIAAPSPMDMTAQQVSGLIQAAQARTPYPIEIKPKSYRDAVQTKAAVTESGIGGSFSGQLPPVQSLSAVGLGYEPTRIADLLPGAAMPGPSATWLSHTANTNEAGIAAEGASKVDLGPSISENQVIPTKIAEKEISMAARAVKQAAEKPATSIKVKVVAPYRVVHDGVAYTGGDVLEVPNDDEHKTWLKARWVELVKEK